MPSPSESKPKLSLLPAIPAEAALSFLKDTKGALAWTARDLANTLKIKRREAEQALAFLQAQGYVQPARDGGPAPKRGAAPGEQQWMTTPPRETGTGAKSPPLTPQRGPQTLA